MNIVLIVLATLTCTLHVLVQALEISISDAPVKAIARIRFKGVIGSVTFQQSANDKNVTLETNFTGLPSNPSNWSINHFPVDLTLDPEYRCSVQYLGKLYNPLNADFSDCVDDNQTASAVGDLTGKFGKLENGVQSYTDMSGSLNLGGVQGIVGRSLVVEIGPYEYVCATIRSSIEYQPTDDIEVTTLSATFIFPLAGVVYLRQAGTEHAVMFGKLYWVDGTDMTLNHNWHVHENMPNTSYREGKCGGIGPHFDPFERPAPSDPTYYCSPYLPNVTNCEVGDLTGKHDTIDVLPNPFPYQEGAFFFTDVFLNLTGTNAVINRSIAIHAADRGAPIIACAPLVKTETRTAQSFLVGEFQAAQASPYEMTVITTNNNFQSTDVDLLPDVLNTYELCPTMRYAYNPFGTAVDNSSTTSDQAAIGALYRKHSYQFASSNTFSVTDFSLFGSDIVSSRTLRTTYNDKRVCTAIPQPVSVSQTLVGVASFDTTIEGVILFFQERLGDGTLGQTNILVDLHYNSSGQETTSGHNWHIHTRPPTSNQPCQGNIGPHFNPFNVSLDSMNEISNYSEDCSPLSKLRCESGDLSGKHGQLTLDPPGTDMSTFSYLDPSLYLYGPETHTIVGRSVGIHENIPGGPILYCAEVRLANITTVQITITEPSNYNRVQFVNDVARQSGVSAQSLLVKQVTVMGGNDQQSSCVNIVLSVLQYPEDTANGEQVVQSSLCDTYRSDECLRSSVDYNSLCPSGAQSLAVISLFVIVLLSFIGSTLVM